MQGDNPNMRNATATATTRRASTRLALSVLIALAALLSIVEVIPAQTTVDYDLDNDGYSTYPPTPNSTPSATT